MIVSTNEMIEILNCSPKTFRDWLASGCPIYRRGDRGTPHLFDTGAVWWREAKVRDRTLAEIKKTNPNHPKQRAALASAEMKELELAEARKELVRVDDVLAMFSQELAYTRSYLLDIGNRLRPRFGKTWPARSMRRWWPR